MITSLKEAVLDKTKPARLLLIDDDQATRELFSAMSAGYNCEWTMASSAQEGIELVRQQPFRIVLLDLRLPCMFGAVAFEKIKEIRPQQPIVIMSGFVDRDAVEQIEKRGFTMFIPKPNPPRRFDRQWVDDMFAALEIQKFPERPSPEADSP